MAGLRLSDDFIFDRITGQVLYPTPLDTPLTAAAADLVPSDDGTVPALLPVMEDSGTGGLDTDPDPDQTDRSFDDIDALAGPDDPWLASAYSAWAPAGSVTVLPGGVVRETISGNDELYVGTPGNDVIYAKGGDDGVNASWGHDKVYGGSGSDFLYGGPGNDTLYGGTGADHLIDDSGKNHLSGGGGNDTIDGGGGRDRANGGDGNDSIEGASGGDVLNGNADDDVVSGQKGADIVLGGGGVDFLYGGGGDDTVKGGSGADWIVGGNGRDILSGGKGADTFVFYDVDDSLAGKSDRDVIKDFDQLAGDRINLSSIDATASPATYSFAFIGNSAFSSTEGELRYTQTASKTLVQADTDGDGVADFVIALDGLFALNAGDFIL